MRQLTLWEWITTQVKYVGYSILLQGWENFNIFIIVLQDFNGESWYHADIDIIVLNIKMHNNAASPITHLCKIFEIKTSLKETC